MASPSELARLIVPKQPYLTPGGLRRAHRCFPPPRFGPRGIFRTLHLQLPYYGIYW